MKKKPDKPADALRVDDPPSPGAAALRRRAEEQLTRQQAQREEHRTKMEMARLVHELEVHQIELEMQNEELQQTRVKAEALLARYTDLFDFAPTGYFNLARDGTIRAVNLTGARLLGIERARLVNRRLGLLVAEADRPVFNAFLEKTFAGKERESCEVVLLKTEEVPLSVLIEAMVSEDRRECRAAVLDITARHEAETERERLIQELQLALSRVKALSGLLPICARCKKIRDDQGYWKQVETYIRSHSEATFTHSICPECRHKLYPEFDDPVPTRTTPDPSARRLPPGQP
jgi:PAS domain S-box-containing protein